MSNFTIVQLYTEKESHLLIDYPCNHIIVEVVHSTTDLLTYEEKVEDGLIKGKGKLLINEFNFEKARNKVKEKVQTDYILSLDADETFIFGNIDYWCKLGKNAYNVSIMNVTKESKYNLSNSVRLFKTDINWFGWAHERPYTDEIYQSDIIFHHTGYTDESKHYGKAKRNNDLIIKSGYALTDAFQRQKLSEGLFLEHKLRG